MKLVWTRDKGGDLDLFVHLKILGGRVVQDSDGWWKALLPPHEGFHASDFDEVDWELIGTFATEREAVDALKAAVLEELKS